MSGSEWQCSSNRGYQGQVGSLTAGAGHGEEEGQPLPGQCHQDPQRVGATAVCAAGLKEIKRGCHESVQQGGKKNNP